MELLAPAIKPVGEILGLGNQREAASELRQIPLDRLGLATEGIKSGMIEIGCGERRVPVGREPPWAIVEALAADRDIVGVQHTVDEARRKIGCGKPGGRIGYALEQSQRIGGGLADRLLAIKLLEAISSEPVEVVDLLEKGQPLETADPDMPVPKPRQHRRAGGGGLVPADQRLAGLEQGEALRSIDPQRLEHLGREHFANPALERQPAVGGPAPRGLARTLGREVEQPVPVVAKLGEQKAAAIAQVGVVMAELMPVIAKRERAGQIAGQWLEPAEMRFPVDLRKSDPCRPAQIAKAWDRRRELRRFHGVIKFVPENEDPWVGSIGLRWRHGISIDD